MTCIIGFADKSGAWIGGDSAAIDGGWDLMHVGESKVFANGKFLIGICGSRRMAQLLQYVLTPPPRTEGDT